MPDKFSLNGIIEKSMLLLVFALILFLGYSNLSGHRLAHPFPYGYMASDAFQHQTRAESIKDAGNYRFEAPYLVMGIENGIGYYPPALYHISVILSYASGVEVYDAIYFLMFLSSALAAMVIYYAIKRFSQNAAILSLPLTILLFYSPLYAGYTWGHWPSILSQFFVVGLVWFACNIDLKYSSVFFIFFLGASIMSHTSESILALIALSSCLIYLLFTRRLKLRKIVELAVASAITVALTFNYLLIFKNVWMYSQPYSFYVEQAWGAPMMFLADWGIILIVFLISAIYCIIHFRKKDIAAFIFSAMFLLLSYGNYIGFGARAFQLRFFWPIYLTFLFGLGIYLLGKLSYKKWNLFHSAILSIVFIVLFSAVHIPFVPKYSEIKLNPDFPGLMTKYHWDNFQWISKNTPADSKIYFFYGDIYDQDATLRNTKRVHFLIIREAEAEALNSRIIERYYLTEPPGAKESLGAKKLSFFKFDVDTAEYKIKTNTSKRDICSFDYIVFDKYASVQQFAEYNKIVAASLLNSTYFSVAHDNPFTVILRNNNPGADCIEERRF